MIVSASGKVDASRFLYELQSDYTSQWPLRVTLPSPVTSHFQAGSNFQSRNNVPYTALFK